MATLNQIQEKIKKLQAQADAITARRKQAALKDIRLLMEKYGLTSTDIESQGWSRKTQTPGLGAGRLGDSASTPRKVSKKGKLPARYRNPKTGETWSGWARPPAWIKNVKDRSKYLIQNQDIGDVAASAPRTNTPGSPRVRKSSVRLARSGVESTAGVKNVLANGTTSQPRKSVSKAAGESKKGSAIVRSRVVAGTSQKKRGSSSGSGASSIGDTGSASRAGMGTDRAAEDAAGTTS